MLHGMAAQRIRNLYDPASSEPFKLSRSKIELFINCPQCFYLDRRLGVGRVDGPGFSLNIAVDALLKSEFDAYRARGESHPLMKEHGIRLVPFKHPELDEWRKNFTGIQYLDPKTNFLVTGAIDDVWTDTEGKLSIVDYKATSTKQEISLEGEYKAAYKRQMDIYQWLFRKNGFAVSDTGYFVYVNGISTLPSFDGKLEFGMEIIPYEGDDGWVQDALSEAHLCLRSDAAPPSAADCKWCGYRKDAQAAIAR
jgi:hypothetical protein